MIRIEMKSSKGLYLDVLSRLARGGGGGGGGGKKKRRVIFSEFLSSSSSSSSSTAAPPPSMVPSPYQTSSNTRSLPKPTSSHRELQEPSQSSSSKGTWQKYDDFDDSRRRSSSSSSSSQIKGILKSSSSPSSSSSSHRRDDRYQSRSSSSYQSRDSSRSSHRQDDRSSSQHDNRRSSSSSSYRQETSRAPPRSQQPDQGRWAYRDPPPPASSSGGGGPSYSQPPPQRGGGGDGGRSYMDRPPPQVSAPPPPQPQRQLPPTQMQTPPPQMRRPPQQMQAPPPQMQGPPPQMQMPPPQQMQMQQQQLPPRQEENREMLEMKAQLKALTEKLAQTEAKVKVFEEDKMAQPPPQMQQQQQQQQQYRQQQYPQQQQPQFQQEPEYRRQQQYQQPPPPPPPRRDPTPPPIKRSRYEEEEEARRRRESYERDERRGRSVESPRHVVVHQQRGREEHDFDRYDRRGGSHGRQEFARGSRSVDRYHAAAEEEFRLRRGHPEEGVNRGRSVEVDHRTRSEPREGEFRPRHSEHPMQQQQQQQQSEEDLREMLARRPVYQHRSVEEEQQQQQHQEQQQQQQNVRLEGQFWLNVHFIKELMFKNIVFVDWDTLKRVLDESKRSLNIPGAPTEGPLRPLVVIVVSHRNAKVVLSLVSKLQGMFGHERVVGALEARGDVWQSLEIRPPQPVPLQADFLVTNGLVPPACRKVRSVFCLGVPLLDGRIGEFMDRWCDYLEVVLKESRWTHRYKVLSRIFGTATVPSQGRELREWYLRRGGKDRINQKSQFDFSFLDEKKTPAATTTSTTTAPAATPKAAETSAASKPATTPKTTTATTVSSASKKVPAKRIEPPAAAASASAASTARKDEDAPPPPKKKRTPITAPTDDDDETPTPKKVAGVGGKKSKGETDKKEDEEEVVILEESKPVEEKGEKAKKGEVKEAAEESEAAPEKSAPSPVALELQDDDVYMEEEDEEEMEDCLEIGAEQYEFGDEATEEEGRSETPKPKKKAEIYAEDAGSAVGGEEKSCRKSDCVVTLKYEPFEDLDSKSSELKGEHRIVFRGQGRVLPNPKNLNCIATDAELALTKELEDGLKVEGETRPLFLVVYGDKQYPSEFYALVNRLEAKFGEGKVCALEWGDEEDGEWAAHGVNAPTEVQESTTEVVVARGFAPLQVEGRRVTRVFGLGVPHASLDENGKVTR